MVRGGAKGGHPLLDFPLNPPPGDRSPTSTWSQVCCVGVIVFGVSVFPGMVADVYESYETSGGTEGEPNPDTAVGSGREARGRSSHGSQGHGHGHGRPHGHGNPQGVRPGQGERRRSMSLMAGAVDGAVQRGESRRDSLRAGRAGGDSCGSAVGAGDAVGVGVGVGGEKGGSGGQDTRGSDTGSDWARGEELEVLEDAIAEVNDKVLRLDEALAAVSASAAASDAKLDRVLRLLEQQQEIHGRGASL